jgi:hypothetical protein
VADFAKLLQKGKTASGPRPPPKVITLLPSDWADQREDKPLEPRQIGIKLISEQDTDIARAEAAKIAAELITVGSEDDRTVAYNCALMRFAAQAGVCSPTDVDEPLFMLGELEIRERLTPEGVRKIFHAIDALHVGSNPSNGEIDPEGAAELFALLDRGALDQLNEIDSSAAGQVKRLLEYCRATLAQAVE